jgi:hypothetical protein
MPRFADAFTAEQLLPVISSAGAKFLAMRRGQGAETGRAIALFRAFLRSWHV